MVAREVRARADEVRADPPDLDDVIGDEPVAPDDEIERALALPDAALADRRSAEPVDVDEDAVERR